MSKRQILYAATDAWLSRQVLVKMYRNHGNNHIHNFCVDYLDIKPAWTRPLKAVNSGGGGVREKEVGVFSGVF
jgi:hypothetical protein